jgi:hypothetical protein
MHIYQRQQRYMIDYTSGIMVQNDGQTRKLQLKVSLKIYLYLPGRVSHF